MRRSHCALMTAPVSRLPKMMIHFLAVDLSLLVLELALKRLHEHTVPNSTSHLTDAVCNLCRSGIARVSSHLRVDHLDSKLQTTSRSHSQAQQDPPKHLLSFIGRRQMRSSWKHWSHQKIVYF